jgi:hypothetical protein
VKEYVRGADLVSAFACILLAVMLLRVLGCAGILLLIASPASAQWAKPRDPSVPRTRDGRPNLTAPTPRTADGKPDLSGMWLSNIKYNFDLAADLKEGVPMTPWAKALYDERTKNFSRDDPENYCLPDGVPRYWAAGGTPSRIIQTTGMIVILHEIKTMFRQIYMDGRTLQPDAPPAWLGYSTGKWEGDVLVVRTAGFNDKTWLDDNGHPHSESLVVTERFRRPDFGHLFIDITIEDPIAYTHPWTVTEDFRLDADGDLLEYVCNENERDLRHIVPSSR